MKTALKTLCTGAALLSLLLSPAPRALAADGSPAAGGRVIILGFDGVEPSIVDAMLAAGELPRLDALRRQGVYTRLESSNPPQSPTAWSSFTTCRNPGAHGVYDFLRRDPRTYLPEVGFGAAKQPELAPDGAVAKPAEFVSYRKGTSFWKAADGQGARSVLLSVPFAYPAEDLQDGCMLCGLGVPDIRGTTSTFFYMSDGFTPAELNEDLGGGMRIPLKFEGDTASFDLPGARDPRRRSSDPDAWTKVPIKVTADRAAHSVTLDLPTGPITLPERTWSKWIEWTFPVTPQFTVRAISRVHVLEAGEQVRLYMTCLMFDPRAPFMRMSTPPEYAAELARRYGLYKTIGWIHDTHALRVGALPEDVFLEEARNTMAWRETLTLDEIDRGNFTLLVSAWTATDRVAHMFWRFRDPKHPLYTEEGAKAYGRVVEDTYARMDDIVGKVAGRLQEGDLLMVLSDHGFHSFRTGFNVNTWLIRNGYLAVKGQSDPATASNDTPFLQGYDWQRSKAYSLGLGSIFLNLQGREREGIVAPADASTLMQELRARLMEVKDPATGDAVFREVYTRDVYRGEALDEAPDLELGYAEGYQSSKDAAKGAAPAALFEPNTSKWSGEHAASDAAFTPGVFFCNRAINTDKPRLVDLGVTALHFLGLQVPPDYEGRSLL